MAPSRTQEIEEKFLADELRHAARAFDIRVTSRNKYELARALSRRHVSNAQIRRANNSRPSSSSRSYAVVRSSRNTIAPTRSSSYRERFPGGQHTLTTSGDGRMYASTYARIGSGHRRLIRDEFHSYSTAVSGMSGAVQAHMGLHRHSQNFLDGKECFLQRTRTAGGLVAPCD